jgi:hypothetical protein
MRQFLIVLFFGIMLSNCKSKPINQKIDRKKEGVWVDTYEQDK